MSLGKRSDASSPSPPVQFVKFRSFVIPRQLYMTFSMRTLSRTLVLLISFSVVLQDVQAAAKPQNEAVNFNFASFDQNSASNNLTMQNSASYSLGDKISITPNTGNTTLSYSAKGQVVYKDGIRMQDPASNSTASFNTSFSFEITRINADALHGADGIAFFMVGNKSIIAQSSESGSKLGLFSTQNGSICGESLTSTFAVEFDTYLSAECGDPDDNHVGVDINSAKSIMTANAGIQLNRGELITVWIEYYHDKTLLEIRISNTSKRPIDPLISNSSLDLSTVFQEFMWVGFSGSTGSHFQYQTLDTWSFSAYGLPVSKAVHKKSHAAIIGVGIAGSVVALAIVAVAFYFYFRSSSPEQDDLVIAVDAPHRFSYKQLSVATNGFSDKAKLGGGGFGSVYRGNLPPNSNAGTEIPVAVKKMSHDSKQGLREFLAEVSIISRLRHRNLVQLLGWCNDDGKFLLVYELMPKGSLDQVLFDDGSKDCPVLPWPQRLKILRGIAAALHYLHEGWEKQVIHRDVKASNVMLDDKFNAKLGDFGLARLNEHQAKAQTTMPAGTWGYMAPECAQTGISTEKSDVFSFGALLLEIASGRIALDRSLPPRDALLVDWTWGLLSKDQILEAADIRLEGEFEKSQMQVVLLVGLLCSHPDPVQRPTMRLVTQILEGEAPVPPIPRSQPVANYASSPARLLYQSLMIDSTVSTLTSSSASGGSRVDSATAALLQSDERSAEMPTKSATDHLQIYDLL